MTLAISGKYKDRLIYANQSIEERAWHSNKIVDDFGRYLAALMKREFNSLIGIEYIAVGGGHRSDPNIFETNYNNFTSNIRTFFNNAKSHDDFTPYQNGNQWVWAKKIDKDSIKCLSVDAADNDVVISDSSNFIDVTNRIQIVVQFNQNEPSEISLIFNEFALVGILQNSNESDKPFNTDSLFFINFVSHGDITKVSSTVLERTIQLSFPVNSNQE